MAHRQTVRRLLAVLVATAWLAATATAQPTDGEWAKVTLLPNGWTYLGSDGQEVGYYRLPIIHAPNSPPRLWTRAEHVRPVRTVGPLYRSAVTLSEFDCAQGRARPIQESHYSSNNLVDYVSPSLTSPGPWQYPEPGTLGELAQNVVCGHT